MVPSTKERYKVYSGPELTGSYAGISDYISVESPRLCKVNPTGATLMKPLPKYKPHYTPLLILLGSYTLLAITTSLFGIDSVYEIHELTNGNAARFFKHSCTVNPLLLMETTYHRSDLFVAGLTLPFQTILGSSMVAIRLMGYGYSVAILLLIFALGRDFFGLRAAWYASLLYVFAPIMYWQKFYLAKGTHREYLLPVLLLYWLLGKKWFPATGPEKPDASRVSEIGSWVLIGGLVPFSLFLSTSAVVMLTPVLIWLLLRGVYRPEIRSLTSVAIGLAIGTAPSLWFRYHGGRFLVLHEERLPVSSSLISVGVSIARRIVAITKNLLTSYGNLVPPEADPLVMQTLTQAVMACILMLIVGFTVVRTVLSRRVTKELVLTLPILILLLAYSGSSLPIDPITYYMDMRYFLPTYPFVIIMTGRVLTRIARMKGLSKLPGFVILALSMHGVFGHPMLWQAGNPLRVKNYHGYTLYTFAGGLQPAANLPDFIEFPLTIDWLPVEERWQAYAGYARNSKQSLTIEQFFEYLKSIPEFYQTAFVQGGIQPGHETLLEQPERLEAFLERLRPELRYHALFRLGYLAFKRIPTLPELTAKIQTQSIEQLTPCIRGWAAARCRSNMLLHLTADAHVASLEWFNRETAALPPTLREESYYSLAYINLFKAALDNTTIFTRLIRNSVPEDYRAAALRGMGARLTAVYWNDHAKLRHELDKLTTEQQSWVIRGMGEELALTFPFDLQVSELWLKELAERERGWFVAGTKAALITGRQAD